MTFHYRVNLFLLFNFYLHFFSKFGSISSQFFFLFICDTTKLIICVMDANPM